MRPRQRVSHKCPLQTTGKKFGVSELGPDVVNFISHATQQRLQNLLEKVTQVAQLKNLSLKVPILFGSSLKFADAIAASRPPASFLFTLQEVEQHEQLDDVRTQLKFFEQLDQMEKQRKEEQEREILLKAAKVTGSQRSAVTPHFLRRIENQSTGQVTEYND